MYDFDKYYFILNYKHFCSKLGCTQIILYLHYLLIIIIDHSIIKGLGKIGVKVSAK